MMVTVSGRRPSRTAVDRLLCLLTALVTASGSVDRLVGWMPHATIVPLAACQGLALLPRRRAPLAALAATTLLGAFMISVGCAAGAASFGVYGAAYAVAVYGGGGEGAELAEDAAGRIAVLIAAAAVVMVASTAPGARSLPVPWGMVALGAAGRLRLGPRLRDPHPRATSPNSRTAPPGWRQRRASARRAPS